MTRIAEINVFPNPTVSEFNIDLDAFKGEAVSIYVIDYYERTLMQAQTAERNIRFNSDALASGSYLILVRSESGKTAVATLLKP